MSAGRLATKTRVFRLVIEAEDSDSYGLRLEETNGNAAARPKLVARVTPAGAQSVSDATHQAIRESGQPKTSLSSGRRKPILLDEPAGVRLALTLLAVEPIAKPSRRHGIVAGIAAMSTEETYYWYAKCTGATATRARRALRILLADDGRTGVTS